MVCIHAHPKTILQSIECVIGTIQSIEGVTDELCMHGSLADNRDGAGEHP
jgi:hypothetical protein